MKGYLEVDNIQFSKAKEAYQQAINKKMPIRVWKCGYGDMWNGDYTLIGTYHVYPFLNYWFFKIWLKFVFYISGKVHRGW